ncbi:MAG: hypothetical protein ACYYK0_07295 [Candidatus Eutrophobiaceae bacterium]
MNDTKIPMVPLNRRDHQLFSSLPQKVRGISFPAVLFMAFVIGGYVLVGLCAFPLVNMQLKIKSMMTTIAELPQEELTSDKQIVRRLRINAGINNVPPLSASAIKNDKGRVIIETNRKTKVKTLYIKFSEENQLFRNFSLIMNFHESVELGTGNVEIISILEDQ